MKKSLAFAIFASALMFVPTALAERSETQSFVAGNGGLVVYTNGNTGSGFDVGGNRFFLEGDETSVTITVSAPSTNSISWFNGAGVQTAGPGFCTSGTFEIPADAVRFTVFVGSDVTGLALTDITCGVLVAPAAGTITADFV